LLPLYTGQKAHLFQGQLRTTRTSRLCASEGGRIGPCSKDGVTGRSMGPPEASGNRLTFVS
jgi:hypothetical protein